MASPPEAPPSEAPSAQAVEDESALPGPLDQARIWSRAQHAWGSLRWRTGLLVVGSLLGCQAMAASRPITAPVALVMPQGLDGARDAFLQGLALGEEAIQACGAEPASLVMHSLPADADPLVLFPRDGNNQPVVPPLVVAPFGADLRSYSRLAAEGDTRVLLGHQRGTALSALPGLDEQGRVWPLLPSRQDELRTLVKATIDRGWKRVMVVTDPSALEADHAQAFVELFEGMGGKVLSYSDASVQVIDPSDAQRLALFEKDLDWLGPDAMVLAAPANGALASVLRKHQAAPETYRRPAWVWLLSRAQAVAVSSQPWPQLVLDQPAHGPGWRDFSAAFEQRWGTSPDLIAAAGYETARVLALTTLAPAPLAADGRRDPMAWVDPGADPVALCQAIERRRNGDTARLEGVASDFALRPSQTPKGEAQSRLITAQ